MLCTGILLACSLFDLHFDQPLVAKAHASHKSCARPPKRQPAGPRPVLVAVELDATVRVLDRTEEMLDKVFELHDRRLRKDKERAAEPSPVLPSM